MPAARADHPRHPAALRRLPGLALALVILAGGASTAVAAETARIPAMVAAAEEQMARCWRRVPLRGHASVQPFRVIASLGQDGRVRQVMLVDAGVGEAGQGGGAVVKDALAAAAACRFSLPADLYPLWQTMTFTFALPD